jgi:hypothetical protein
MHTKTIRSSRGPEKPLVLEIMKMLRAKEWFVMKMHGSEFQAGFPDLFATHTKYRVRLIEVKDPNRKGDVFTSAQADLFPKLYAHGCPVYIMTGADEDNYSRLFKEPNFWQYLRIMR